MREILKNSITSWVKWLFHYYSIKKKNPTLIMKNMSYATNSLLGSYNLLHENSSLINSYLGDYSYISRNSIVQNAIIGKFCSIAGNVRIGLGKHPSNHFVSSHPAFYSNREKYYFANKNLFEEFKQIKIGNDVWVGSNVLVCDGVIIGDGAIIAAGSVVTKNVNPYEIVGGIPAKLIRKRFAEDEINFLLEIKWWNWDLDEIKNNAKYFVDIKEFMKLNKKQRI